MATELHNQPMTNEAALLRRTVVLQGACQDGVEKLRTLPAMAWAETSPSQNNIHMRYDVTQIDIDSVMTVLREAGCILRHNWRDRTRMAWYRYVEGNARKNFQSSGGACCSTPTSVYTAQHKPK